MSGRGKSPNTIAARKKHDFSSRTPEEMRAIASAGGRASGQKKREQKTIREFAELILKTKTSKIVAKRIKKELPGIDDDEMCYKLAMVFGQVRAAMNGNTFAFKEIQKAIGETNDNEKTEDKVSDIFDMFEEAIRNK